MNKLHKRRLTYVIFFMVGVGVAASLIFYALKQNLNVFVTPTEIAQKHIDKQYTLRLGAMVKQDSIKRSTENLDVAFIATDFKNDIPVQYTGILPDLFKEGKGMIAEGRMNQQGVFIATRILAKHDENYMPKKVYESLKARG